MASSLFGDSQKIPQQPNNMLGMLQQFQQFKQQMANQDPKAIVQSMIKSGRMSQQQFQQLSAMANQLSGIL